MGVLLRGKRIEPFKPLGVSEYQLTEALPEEFRGALRTVEELEAELKELPVEDEVD